VGKFCEEILLIKTSNYNRLDRLGGRCMVGVERFESPLHIESNFKIILCKFNHF